MQNKNKKHLGFTSGLHPLVGDIIAAMSIYYIQSVLMLLYKHPALLIFMGCIWTVQTVVRPFSKHFDGF